ncbi:MAG: hypothetical protein DIU52_008210 [bacterium]|jgi:hypothetical protein|nr:MAG: hypothetical protein DIU52_12995 [bacterium]
MLLVRPTRLIACALALALAGGPGTAVAQTGMEAVKSRLGAAPRLLLETADGEVVRGRPTGWIDDWLLLSNGRRVAFGEILRAEALYPRTGDGARWGAIAGLLAGAGAYLATRGEDGGEAAVGVGYVSGGTLIGAALGALWGSRRDRSEPIYSAPTANAAPRTGLIEYRRGASPGQVRSNLAVTPFVGVSRYSYRTGRTDGTHEIGLASSREIGLQLQYALGPRSVVRLGASGIHASFRERLGPAPGTRIMDENVWLARAEVALELRMRSSVPGYAVIAADGLYNPHGYAQRVAGEDDIDAGISPRIGAGLGFDFFLREDRRVRIEWIYRLGRYNAPDAAEHGFATSRTTRDWSFTLGFHLPLVRPRHAAE